jgi:hypothetical protein
MKKLKKILRRNPKMNDDEEKITISPEEKILLDKYKADLASAKAKEEAAKLEAEEKAKKKEAYEKLKAEFEPEGEPDIIEDMDKKIAAEVAKLKADLKKEKEKASRPGDDPPVPTTRELASPHYDNMREKIIKGEQPTSNIKKL